MSFGHCHRLDFPVLDTTTIPEMCIAQCNNNSFRIHQSQRLQTLSSTSILAIICHVYFSDYINLIFVLLLKLFNE